MRGEDGDPLGEMNPLDLKFFSSARVNLQIPIIDPVAGRECLLFLQNETPGLIAQMDRLPDRRAKSLLMQGMLRRWNRAFARKAKK
jgi:hypothetical protein